MIRRGRLSLAAPAAVRLWVLAVCLTLACACSAGPPAARPAAAPAHTGPGARLSPATSRPAPAGLDGCLPATAGQVRVIPDPGGGTLTLGVLGAGPQVVILSDESDRNLCSWLAFARRLSAAGDRVVVWDYGGNLPPDELTAIVRWARAHGARRIVLMGASEGAKASLVAAARLGDAVRGVVSLSAESVLAPHIDVAQSVTRVRCRLLLVTAASDPYGSAQAGQVFLRAAPATRKRLLTVPGSAHGTALLSGPPAATVVPAVLAFLRTALSA